MDIRAALDAPVNMRQEGPRAWAALHQWASNFKAKVGGACGCGEFAVKLTRFDHDLVNVHLGKPLHDRENFIGMARAIQESLAKVEAGHTAGQHAARLSQAFMERVLTIPREQKDLHPEEVSRVPVTGKSEAGHSIELNQGPQWHCGNWEHGVYIVPPRLGDWRVVTTRGGHALREVRAASAPEAEILAQKRCAGTPVVAAASTLPLCTPAQRERLERCIMEVKEQGRNVNPWAVCQASLGCRKGPAMRHDDDGEDDGEEPLEERETHRHRSAMRQGFIDMLMAGAASATGATLASLLLGQLSQAAPVPAPLAAPDDRKKEEERDQKRPPSDNPSFVQGDQATVDLGTLMEELDTILADPSRQGLVDADTLRVVREAP